MALHELDSTMMSGVLKLLSESGFVRVASAPEILLDAALRLERDEFLNAAPPNEN